MKFSMHFSSLPCMLHALQYHPPVTSFLVGSNNLPSALFSNSSVCMPIMVLWVNPPDCTVSQVARSRYESLPPQNLFFLRGRYQTSHSYKTSDKFRDSGLLYRANEGTPYVEIMSVRLSMTLASALKPRLISL
jgi:hypothetical protein